jgi:hypothetical protein
LHRIYCVDYFSNIFIHLLRQKREWWIAYNEYSNCAINKIKVVLLHLFELQYIPFFNIVLLLFQYVPVTFEFSELVKQGLLYIQRRSCIIKNKMVIILKFLTEDISNKELLFYPVFKDLYWTEIQIFNIGDTES